MRGNRLVRKLVTDEEFRQALENEDNKKIIKAVLSRYYKLIPADELESCGYYALWRCLGYHQNNKGNKFTTSLWRFIVWECRRTLKYIHKQRSINISSIEKKGKFDIPLSIENPDVIHLKECMNLLSSIDRELIQEYFFNRRTMQEIGKLRGYSKEAVRQKINKAKNELKKRLLGGV